MNPIIRAVAEKNIDEVNRLVSEFVNVRNTVANDQIRIGDTPLMIATMDYYPELVARLIELGADVNFPDLQGNVPLHMATTEFGGGPNDEEGDEIGQKQLTILKTLLAAPGVDVNIRNTIGQTPLEMAITEDDTPFIKTLIEGGADMDIVGSTRLTALEQVLQMIKDEGSSVYMDKNDPWIDLAFYMYKHGARVRPNKIRLLRFLTKTQPGRNNLVQSIKNRTWKRKRDLITAWQKARNNEAAEDDAAAEVNRGDGADAGAGAAGGNINYSNLPPLERVVPGAGEEEAPNQGGGRRRLIRTVRKRKASKKTRRHKHRK